MTNPTRQRVLAAAIRLLDGRSDTQVSIADLVSASGVSNGSIYHHFGSKEGVLEALLLNSATTLNDALLEVLRLNSEDAEECVLRTVETYLRWTEENRTEASLLNRYGRHARNGSDGDQFKQRNLIYETRTAEWLATQKRAGKLSALETKVAHAIVFAPAREVCRVWLEHPEFPSPTSFSKALGTAAWAGLQAAGQTVPLNHRRQR